MLCNEDGCFLNGNDGLVFSAETTRTTSDRSDETSDVCARGRVRRECRQCRWTQQGTAMCSQSGTVDALRFAVVAVVAHASVDRHWTLEMIPKMMPKVRRNKSKTNAWKIHHHYHCCCCRWMMQRRCCHHNHKEQRKRPVAMDRVWPCTGGCGGCTCAARGGRRRARGRRGGARAWQGRRRRGASGRRSCRRGRWRARGGARRPRGGARRRWCCRSRRGRQTRRTSP